MPTESQETSKTYLQINPVEELLKAVGIVHGPQFETAMRHIVATIFDDAKARANTPPWTADRVQAILDTEVKYKDWKFVVKPYDVFINGGWDTLLALRAEWMGADAITGNPELQQSRWWIFSKHAVKTEIIQTAFLSTLKAEEHEIRETFLYNGRAVFNTHIDINTLHMMSDHVDVRVDIRPEAPANQRRE